MIPANKDGSNMAKELMYQFNKSRWKMELPEEVGINLDIGGSNRGRSRLSDRIPHSGGVGHRVPEVVEYSTEEPQSSNGSLEADKEDEGSKQASSVYKQSEDGCEEPYLAELFDFIVTFTMRALGLVGLLTNFAVKLLVMPFVMLAMKPALLRILLFVPEAILQLSVSALMAAVMMTEPRRRRINPKRSFIPVQWENERLLREPNDPITAVPLESYRADPELRR